MKNILIIGAGDFGRETAWLIEDINESEPRYNIVGYLDDRDELSGTKVAGYQVIGKISETLTTLKDGDIYGIIAMQNPCDRKRIVETNPHFIKWETLVHPSCRIPKTAILGEGNIIAAGCIFSVDVKIENHCILNLGCIIGHDCILSNYVSIMPNSSLGGRVFLSEGAYLGTSVSIKPGINVGKYSKVGIGATVIKDVSDGDVVVDYPARLLIIE